MTYILHIETATKACSVAVSQSGSLVSLKEILNDAYAHGEQLTLLIQEAVKTAGIGVKDLAAVSVTAGPGSYTGLRIGLSTAKGLCYALNIPLIFVDAIESLAEIAKAMHPDKRLCGMLDARRMEVYSAIYDSGGSVLKPLSADVLDERSYSEFEPFTCFGDGALKMEELWKARDVAFDTAIHSSASGQCRLAFKRYENKQFEDVAYSDPLYLKEFQGTTPKK